MRRLKGWIEIVHRRDGRLLRRDVIKNVVCNAGLGQVSGYINGVITGKSFAYVAIGTGTTAAAATDTALQSEITTGGGARAAATTSQTTTTVTNDTAQWVITYNFTASFAVTESGIFDAASGGNLLAHQVFSAYNVVNQDSLTLTWKVQD
jgi:hypothetical protein